jgi:hypothetical protein
MNLPGSAALVAALSTSVTACVLSAAAATAPPDTSTNEYGSPTSVVQHRNPTPSAGHPCFLVRAHWNVALDGPQPVC